MLCPTCRTWNLWPFEGRWEGVQELAVVFERALVGAATPNIALASYAGEVELVRIGAAPDSEFAAWRYGDQFVQRRRDLVRTLIRSGNGGFVVGGVGIAAVLAGYPVVSALLLPGWLASSIGKEVLTVMKDMRQPVNTDSDGPAISLYRSMRARLQSVTSVHGWTISVPQGKDEAARLEGAPALRFLRVVLPQINSFGATNNVVRETVRDLEGASSVRLGLRDLAAQVDGSRARGEIMKLPPRTKLAIEMLANEEVERRALQGELQALENEWRDAEAIAAIADQLTIPAVVTDRIRRWRST